MFSPEKQRIWFVKNVPFGAFVDDEMILNKNGEIVESVRNDLPNHYAHVELDYHIIMPNHIHGIITLVGAGLKPAPTDTEKTHGLPVIRGVNIRAQRARLWANP